MAVRREHAGGVRQRQARADFRAEVRIAHGRTGWTAMSPGLERRQFVLIVITDEIGAQPDIQSQARERRPLRVDVR